MLMDFFKKINSHKYIFLGEISEPEDNVLRLVIEEAKVAEDEESIEVLGQELNGLRSIDVSDDSNIYEVIFDSYIGYSVINESYACNSEDDEWEGRLFCIYNESEFLKYLSKASFASEDYPGPYKHYGFNCLNHIVEIASIEQPRIKIIER